MDRRLFLKIVGLSLMAPLHAAVASNRRVQIASADVPEDVVLAGIKAEFGSGFELTEFERVDERYYAKITHLGNQYLVTSTQPRRWKILYSDIV